MNSEIITAFFQEHGELVLILAGVICLAGAFRNWNWLCDPAGTRSAYSVFGRGGRRLAFGVLGVTMLLIGLWLMWKR